MTLLSMLPHGATGTWLDEFIEIGLPVIVLVGLYIWSNRHPSEKQKPK